jgi:hypothetical protein
MEERLTSPLDHGDHPDTSTSFNLVHGEELMLTAQATEHGKRCPARSR